MQRVTASTATIKHVRIDGRVSSCYLKHEAILGAGMSIKPFANRYFRTRHLYSRQSSLSVLPCSSSAGAEIPNEHARRKNPSPRTVCEHAEPSAPLLARHKMVDGVDTLTVVSVGRSSTVGNPSLFAVHRRRQSPVVAHRSPSIVRLRW